MRIVIAEDSVLLRVGLTRLASSHQIPLELLGAGASARPASHAPRQQREGPSAVVRGLRLTATDGLPEQDATAFCRVRSAAESIEFSVMHSAEECVPFVRGKSENWTFGVLAVANADLAFRQARHFYAVTIRKAQGTLYPG
jgi:hypothetical protein